MFKLCYFLRASSESMLIAEIRELSTSCGIWSSTCW